MLPPNRQRSEDDRVVADAIHNRLRSSILSAEWRPNYRLVEEELAQDLEVSRTPVREALLRLEQEGLVERSRGWVVRDHRSSEVRQILEARLAVDSHAARLAATRVSKSQIETLRNLAHQMETEGVTRLSLNLLNMEFHNLVVAAADNPMLGEFHRWTELNYWNLGAPVEFTPADMVIVTQQHHEIINGLAARDPDRAAAATQAHIENTMRVVLAAFGEKPPGSMGRTLTRKGRTTSGQKSRRASG